MHNVLLLCSLQFHYNALQAAKSTAVRDFINDRLEFRVFLLAHKVGAQGLTLVRANHVFLLEPALDPPSYSRQWPGCTASVNNAPLQWSGST